LFVIICTNPQFFLIFAYSHLHFYPPPFPFDPLFLLDTLSFSTLGLLQLLSAQKYPHLATITNNSSTSTTHVGINNNSSNSTHAPPSTPPSHPEPSYRTPQTVVHQIANNIDCKCLFVSQCLFWSCYLSVSWYDAGIDLV